MSSAMCNKRMFNMFAITVISAVLTMAASSFAQTPTKLSRVLPLVRLDGLTVGENPGMILPKGTVKLEINGATQRFTVDAKNMATTYPPGGLAVYIATESTLQYVSVMSSTGTNGHWKLDFKATNNQAPPQLGVASLTDLVGSTILVGGDPSNAVLRATVLELLANPGDLSYQKRVSFNLPKTPLSLKARGYIHVKYNGKTGASLLDAKAMKLNSGNSYVAGEKDAIITATNACAGADLTANGTLRWRHDTSKGDALPGDVDTIIQMSGQEIGVIDCFGGTHLEAVIPYPPYLAPQ